MSADELADLVEKAGFVFKGKIVSSQAEDAEVGAEAEDEALTVEVQEVLSGTEVTRGLVGTNVLVVRERAAAGATGDERVFFTDVVSLGDDVVVREVGQREASAGSMRQVAEGVRIAVERPLAARVADADVIVNGRVTSTKPVGRAPLPFSEHDPEWSVARVAVESVLKGRSTRTTVDVLFASSLDIVWYRSPKLDEGASGIFILRRRDEDEAPDEVGPSVFQATDPLDFLPHDRLGDVRRMIGRETGDR